jgi:uncharacterized protein (DUF1810 family)
MQFDKHMNDPFHLQRFLDAQQPVFERVRAELTDGRKRSHWMWFVFPQIRGLGQSDMARRYAITSLEEAKAYLAHPILGARLRDCSRLVANVKDRSIDTIFGYPDNLKFHSCMTLFAQASNGEAAFTACLQKYFGGEMDGATLRAL